MYVKSILYIIGVSLAVPLFLNSLSENRSIKIIRENDFEENKLIIDSNTNLEDFSLIIEISENLAEFYLKNENK